MSAEEKVDIMYKVFDEAAEKHLVKKTIYDYDNSVKRKFIPAYI